MRALGRENLTNSNPVDRAVNAMPTKISTEQTEWPYNVAGYISPKPTVADVSMLKKNASAIEPGRALAIAPGFARNSIAKLKLIARYTAIASKMKRGQLSAMTI